MDKERKIDFSAGWETPLPLENGHEAPTKRTNRDRWRSVKNSKLGRVIIYIIAFLLIAGAGVGGWIGYKADTGRLRFNTIDDSNSLDGIAMIGQLAQVDLTNLYATFFWSIGGFGNYSTDPSGDLNDVNTDVYIYQDGLPTPIGTYYSAIAAVNDQSFTTRVRITSDSSADFSPVPSTVKYPLDTYGITSTFGARVVSSNVTIPIYYANLLGNIQGWETTTNDTLIRYSGSSGWSYPDGRRLSIHLRRSGAMIAFAIIIQAVMWCISLVILYLAILGSLFGRKVTVQLFGIPATVLFALPALRNVMPQAPGFGTYMDICGLLMNEIIVAGSIVALLVAHVARTKFDSF